VQLLGQGHHAEEEEQEEDAAEVEEVRVVHALPVGVLLLLHLGVFLAYGGRRQVRHVEVEVDAGVNA